MDLIASNYPYSHKVTLMKQYCEGLKFLDDIKLMHRDIKPQNLAVATLNPAWGVITDFASATFDEKPWKAIGNRSYASPELRSIYKVVDLQVHELSPSLAYTRAVDMYGLGLSMLELFLGYTLLKFNVLIPDTIWSTTLEKLENLKADKTEGE